MKLSIKFWEKLKDKFYKAWKNQVYQCSEISIFKYNCKNNNDVLKNMGNKSSHTSFGHNPTLNSKLIESEPGLQIYQNSEG